MREVIFRGKRIDNGEWVEGYFGKYFDGDEKVICITLEEWTLLNSEDD